MASKGPRSKIDHKSRAKLQKVSFNLLEKYLEAHSKASMWENELLDVGYQPLCIQIPYTMFTQLHFTYEQESDPEEFFIPYVWKLVLSKCEFEFNATIINLFPADIPTKKLDNEVEGNTFQNSDFDEV